MTRLSLRLYIDPGGAELFVNIRFKDRTYERLTAVIDTGAEQSLFPINLLDKAEHRLLSPVTIEQAGIARQSFKAEDALINIFLEDSLGHHTIGFEIRAWFANTKTVVLGFKDVLENAVLHLDMPALDGWIELDESRLKKLE